MSVYMCQFCGREFARGCAYAKHEKSCVKNPNRLPGENQFTKAEKQGMPKPPGTMAGKPGTFKGKKHTEETKKKISESMKKFMEENPDMSPWVHSHYTKRKSYAERYWKKVLTKCDIDFEEQYQVSRYCLDFAVVESKIDIEIDGEQHYCDQRIVESDERRNKYLESLGWKVIRIRWSEYKKLVNKKDRIEFINSVIRNIRSNH